MSPAAVHARSQRPAVRVAVQRHAPQVYVPPSRQKANWGPSGTGCCCCVRGWLISGTPLGLGPVSRLQYLRRGLRTDGCHNPTPINARTHPRAHRPLLKHPSMLAARRCLAPAAAATPRSQLASPLHRSLPLPAAPRLRLTFATPAAATPNPSLSVGVCTAKMATTPQPLATTTTATTTTTTTAVRVEATGGPKAMALRHGVPLPPLGPGLILVRNHAVGINFRDCYHRQGQVGRSGRVSLARAGGARLGLAGSSCSSTHLHERQKRPGYVPRQGYVCSCLLAPPHAATR